MDHYEYRDSQQQLFNYQRSRLALVCKWVWQLAKIVVPFFLRYAPLLVAGNIIANWFITAKHDPFNQFVGTMVGAYLLFQLVFFLKGILIGCQQHKGFFVAMFIWVLLMVLVCLPVPLVLYEALPKRLPGQWRLAAILALIGIAFFIYHYYDFLTDKAPGLAMAVYRAGLRLAS